MRRAVLASVCLASLVAATSGPATAQEIVGSGVIPRESGNSAERPVGFGTSAPADAALAILTASPSIPAEVPLNEAERAAIVAAVASGRFTAKANEVLSLRGVGARPRIVLVGTGQGTGAVSIQDAAGRAAQELQGENAPVAIAVSGGAGAMTDAALGYTLGQYRFDRYKSRSGPAPSTLPATIVGADAAAAGQGWSARHAGIAEGVRFTRDLVTEPAGVIYPESFVARTRAAFTGLPVTIEVLDEAAMRRLNMGAIVGVGQGSRRGSRLMLVSYKGAGGAPLALVGKGITFDSGGISIKGAAGMYQMKGDMAGAAAVMGATLALARGRAPVNVVAVAALAENMPGGNAQRPGDVVRTMSGKTIEVVNTDAEGRLVLADAIEYTVNKHRPAAVVDMATLTGAIVGALGDEYAGLFARDEGLANALTQAGQRSGEAVWRMPLHPNHAEDIKSDIADVRNSTEGGQPGASHGAAFIGHFVDPSVPWAHVDIAGTFYAAKALPTVPKGFTGYGVRLLEEFARNWRPAG